MKPHLYLTPASLLLAAAAFAQPTITSLGSGVPNSVGSSGGTIYVGGTLGTTAGRWALTGGSLSNVSIAGSTGSGLVSGNGAYSTALIQNGTTNRIFGNTATGVSPAFSTSPTLVASTTQPAATESCAGRWDGTSIQRLGALPITPSLMVYGSGSNGGSTGAFQNPFGISSTGRFVVGNNYVSSYSSSAGTTISDSTFNWRPYIWDAQANGGAGGCTVLPTPLRTSNNTWRRRTGQAYDVSADGTVIVGAQEHNSATASGPDPDGARLVVWRWDGSNYVMSFLPNGNNGGNFHTYSQTAGSVLINDAGTIIVARAIDNAGTTVFPGKWVWNAGTSTWDGPTNLAPNLMSAPASWLPAAVTGCNIPVTFFPTGMSEDGNTVVGEARYSTCGSFMSGGFIWTANDNIMSDWYDYLVAQNTPGISSYGPIGDNGDPTRGLPRLGFPTSISSDGNVIVNFQGGTQRIPGAVSSMVQMTGGTACVAPTITQNPSNATFSRCSFGTTLSSVALTAFAQGTAPFTYQWYKNGSPIADGTTANGSVITGATSFQMRITKPAPADAGSYTCTITGCNGQSATTTVATVAADSAVPTVANDTSAGALSIGEGTANFNICGAYVDDGASTCGGAEQADIWYRYTPTFTGNARFQTCGSSFDTTVQIYSDTTTNGGFVLACNNDVGSRGIVGTTCNQFRSLISSFPVTAGQPVYVRVGAVSTPTSNATTTGALTISQAPATPPNDQCTGAMSVGVGTFTSPASFFNLAEATDDYIIGVDICSTTGETTAASNRDVWFRLSSQCGGTYTIDTCGSALTNPMLHVFDSCGGGVIACRDNVGSGVSGCTSNQARISNLTITGDVLIRVSNSGTGVPTTGSFQLTITGAPNGCCGPQDFNGDGDFGTDQDIEAFFACLGGNCCATCWPAGADFNGDGDIGTDQDIEAFFRVLGGGNC